MLMLVEVRTMEYCERLELRVTLCMYGSLLKV
jgi:hypothetical protein